MRLEAPARSGGLELLSQRRGVVASRVTELGGAINEVVGLTREQFVSTIVLPQGEFARFLRSGTDDKRKILQSIFRTHLFQKVQDRLKAAGIAAQRQCAVADAALQTALDTLRGAAGEEHAAALADLVPGTESQAMRERAVGIIDTVAERAEAADDAPAATESAYRGAAAQLAALDSPIELRNTLAAATEQCAALQAGAAEVAAQQDALRDDDRASRVADAQATADRLIAASRAADDALDTARRAAPAEITRADPTTCSSARTRPGNCSAHWRASCGLSRTFPRGPTGTADCSARPPTFRAGPRACSPTSHRCLATPSGPTGTGTGRPAGAGRTGTADRGGDRRCTRSRRGRRCVGGPARVSGARRGGDRRSSRRLGLG